MPTIYIPTHCIEAASHYKHCFDRLGVQVTTEYSTTTDAVMVFADRDCRAIADHPRYMPKESLDILLIRDRMHETGVPVLPTHYVKDGAPTKEGMFIKPRDSAFQRGLAGWVEQPHLGFPIEDIDVTVAVNQYSEVMLYDTHHMTHYDYKKPADTRPIDKEALQIATRHIETVCKNLSITGGIHNVQFLKYNNEWCLTDWNPRPGESHTIGLVSLNPFSDTPLAFMLGLPIPTQVPHAIATKSYWDNPIPFGTESLMQKYSLFGRRAYKVNGYARLTAVASTIEELNHNFKEYETLARQHTPAKLL